LVSSNSSCIILPDREKSFSIIIICNIWGHFAYFSCLQYLAFSQQFALLKKLHT
jgi:hypothetical protein